jgi:hypothetical protein
MYSGEFEGNLGEIRLIQEQNTEILRKTMLMKSSIFPVICISLNKIDKLLSSINP